MTEKTRQEKLEQYSKLVDVKNMLQNLKLQIIQKVNRINNELDKLGEELL